jgi:4-carboxymuconolactone decarboxylase
MTSGPDRMPPLPAEEWTDAQRTAAATFAANRRQEVFGPFAVLLRSPEVMLRAMAMGDYMRYRTVLPARLNELLIILTARRWTQQFEWFTHQPAALAAGVSPEIVQAVAEGRRPARMDDGETIVYEFATELLRDESVSDATYARAAAALGDQGVIDMIGVIGYYTFLSFVMNATRTPVPVDSTVSPLPPLPD